MPHFVGFGAAEKPHAVDPQGNGLSYLNVNLTRYTNIYRKIPTARLSPPPAQKGGGVEIWKNERRKYPASTANIYRDVLK